MAVSAWLRERFGRKTNSGRFIAEIDGLRFPAIAIVVLGHLCAHFIDRPGAAALQGGGGADRFIMSASAHAREGVVLFFIISGFVLALPFAAAWLKEGPRVGLRGYYLRRLTRLEPPYLISLLGFLVIKILARRFHLVAGDETTSVLLRHFAASAVYLHNLVYGTGSMINGVAWSLEVEVQFYLLVPLLTQVFRIRSILARRGWMLAGIVAAIAFQQAFIVSEGRLSLSVLGSVQYFLVGFLLADLYLVDGIGMTERRFGWDLLSLAAWPLLFVLWTPAVATPVLIPFVGLVAFVAVFRGRVSNRIFTNPWITTFGGMCYSIYLLHFMVIGIVGKVLAHRLRPSASVWRDVLVQGPLLLAVALACSLVFFVAIERPCMDRRWPARVVAWAKRRLGVSRFSPVAESEI